MSNVVETIALLKICVSEKVKKIVFISSGGAIYGTPLSLPVSEECPNHPLSSYGVSKLAIEKYIEIFYHLYGLDYVIVRPSNPYGERQNPLSDQGVIAVFLGKIAKNLPLEIWGDGNAIKDYIYIEDLIDGIYKAAFCKSNYRIFNLGSGKGYSLSNILNIIKDVVHVPISISPMVSEKFDVQKIYLDISRAKNELAWEPRISLNEGISRTWKFIQEIKSNINF
jgi:UDP-glucose 4-epimerase